VASWPLEVVCLSLPVPLPVSTGRQQFLPSPRSLLLLEMCGEMLMVRMRVRGGGRGAEVMRFRESSPHTLS
jgi:hypothetical protein